jgi:Spy/CpxP family protein refolding chaperone
MKIVRIAGLAIALCAASASLAAAQGRPDSAPPGGRRGGMMGGRMLDGITLTDAQQAQMKTIREKYMPKMAALRDSLMTTGTAQADMRAKMQPLNDAYVAEIRAILTADQQATLDKNIEAAKARMRSGPPPSGN